MPVTTIRGGRQITDGTIPYVDIQNVTASRLLGNPTVSAATMSEISLGTGLSFSSGSLVLSANLQSLSGLTYSSASFVKMTAAGTFALDTNTYITGSGSTNVLPKWTSSSSLGNSLLDDDGTSASVALAAGGKFNIKYLSAIKLALTGGTTFGSVDIAAGLDFLIRPDSIEKFKLSSTGLLKLANYGAGSVTGTATYRLAVDASGNVIEVSDGGGTVTSVSGTGTVSGLTLTGTVTSSGSLTLGGTLTLTSGQVTTALGYTPYNSTNPSGYTSNTGTVTSVSGTGTVSGLTLTGTVTTTGSLTLGGTLSASIDNITDEHRLFNNMGDNHSTRTSFDATNPSYNFGWRFVQGNTNGPGVNSATQYYSVYVGLGNDYLATGAGSYGMQLAIPRNVTTPYISVRYNENNGLGSWQKIAAGYADTAGALTSMNISQFTNNSGYITSSALGAYLPLAGGTMTGDINWATTDRGLTWGMNTDGAYIKFYNTGDGDTNSRLEYGTSDNNNEYHRFLISSNERFTIKDDAARFNNNVVWHAGNDGSGSGLDADLLDGINSSGFIRTYGTTNNNINSDYGECFITFDPVPSGTPPISSPNLRTINVGSDFNRRTQLAFDYATDRGFFRRKYDSTWSSWVEFIHTGNYNSYSPTLTGGGASGTWGIDITGSAAMWGGYYTPTRTNWQSRSAGDLVMGQMGWKHYGNNHTIIDASNSTAPDGSTISNTNSQVGWSSTYPTLMGWNGTNTYGVRVDQARYADSAYYATVLTAAGALTTQTGSGTVIYSNALTVNQAGLFPGNDNANSILTVNRHPGDYYSQLGFSSNGNLYYRNFVNTAINTSQGWQTVWTSSSLTNLNQLVNGPGYITGSYIATTGDNYGQGNYEFASNDNSSTSYNVAAVELRESLRGGSGSYNAPRLAFHWGGVVASQISIESGGRIVIRDNPGTGYQTFAAAGITAYGNILASGDRPTEISITDGAIYTTANSGGWAMGHYYKGSSGTVLAGFGAYGSANTLNYAWIGSAWDSPWLTIAPAITTFYNQADFVATYSGDHGIRVGGVRGRPTGNQTGDYIHLYERVHIGSPNGWGATTATAPAYGLGVYGGANIGFGNNASLFAYAYRGNGNVGGTGEASWHPAGIYSGGTQWLYGTTYRNSAATYGQGNLYFDGNYGYGMVGLYSDTRYQAVFAMGDSYKLPADGTTTGSLYGLAWSHPNKGGVAANLSTHGLLVMENGGFLAAISGSIRARDDMRAPIFYDSNDTTYYIDPNATSNIYKIRIGNGTEILGFVGMGANYWYGMGINSAYTAVYAHYAGNGVALGAYDGTTFTPKLYVNNDGNVIATGSLRAPIFYDSGNASYYLDGNNNNAWRIGTPSGYLEIGPMNSSYCHFYTSTGNFYFGSRIDVNGEIWRYGGQRFVENTGTWGISITGDAGSVDGIDSSRIVYGDGSRGKSTSKTNANANTSDSSNPSGFFFGNNTTGMPSADWWNWINVAGDSWSGGDGYGFQLANSFWGDDLRFRRLQSGTWYSWIQILTSGNISSYAITSLAGETLQQVMNRGASSSTYMTLTGGGTFNSGQYYFKSNRGAGVYLKDSNSAQLQVFSDDSSAAFMSFHRGGYYAVNMGLDPDNVFRIGGWSAGANVLQLDMAGNLYSGASMYPGGHVYFANESSPYTNTIRFGDNTGWIFRMQTSVSGTYTTRFSFSDGGTFTAVGDVVAYSDARVKTNVATITDPLDKVTKMRGVTYNRTDSIDTSEKVGVIAQEIQEVLPQVVTEDKDGMLGVSYGNLAGVFIEAFKEQQRQIEELKKQIEYLVENK